jgi:glycosyltransferase involved in cell wall biosynthesis
MEKILTISIAAYNVEGYIRQTLNSLIAPEILDKLEVFVVDDGGNDGTLAIAKEYEAKYPGTFHAVHKENGGYGSTINYSVEHATGKFFKQLDGDDWFQTDNLVALVKVLETLDTDCVYTQTI